MKKVGKYLAIILSLALMVSIFAGCDTSTPTPSSTPDDTREKRDTFVFVGDQPNTLNMIQSVSNMDSQIFYLTSAMMFRPYDGIWYPEVCETMDVSSDGLVYTYHLRDAAFSDGTPITADDFVYYLISILDPANGSAAAANIVTYGILNSDKFSAGEVTAEEVGIKALDEKTVEITMSAPNALFDGKFTWYPLNGEFVKSKGEALGGTPADLMYSGPYILTEWTYDSYMLFKKNDSYIDSATSFPTPNIKMVVSYDNNTRVAMFESGEVDALMSVGYEISGILSDYLVDNIGSAMQGIQFNRYGKGGAEANAALMSNQNFRLALSYALNREAIVAAVSPAAKPLVRFTNPLSYGNTDETRFVDDYSMNTPPSAGDATKAKEYLEKALDDLGYSSVSELPKLEYLTFEFDVFRVSAETVIDQWKQVLGLDNITITLLPVPQAIGAMMSYDYDIYYTALSTDMNPISFMTYWTSGGTVNDVTGSGRPLFSDEKYDSLIADAMVETDRVKRMEMLAEAEQILIDAAVIIPFRDDSGYSAAQSYVEGFVVNSFDQAYEFNNVVVYK